MKKIDVIIGTRPEAIKMAPVVRALRARPGLEVRLVSTGQHRELMHQALDAFGLTLDGDLRVMEPGQSLARLSAKILIGLDERFDRDRPDLVLGHGDTSSCYGAALACFYRGLPFFHVEAGLRSGSLETPFPEEFNRQSVARIATHHFPPSLMARDRLIAEGIANEAVTLTPGSTLLDSVKATSKCAPDLPLAGRRLLTLTLHRRETGTTGFEQILASLRSTLLRHPETYVVFPMHPNPAVIQAAQAHLGDLPNVLLAPPLGYADFLGMLARSELVLTDSGGVQEEAAQLGRPTLLLRDTTEREDGMADGLVRLVGSDGTRIAQALDEQLLRPTLRVAVRPSSSPRSGSSPSELVADVVVARLYG